MKSAAAATKASRKKFLKKLLGYCLNWHIGCLWYPNICPLGMTKPKVTPNCKKGKRKPWNFLDLFNSYRFSFEVCSSSNEGEQKIKFVKNTRLLLKFAYWAPMDGTLILDFWVYKAQSHS